MENIKTGRVIDASSLSEFCRIANLNGSDRYHITPVVYRPQNRMYGSGFRLHHKNWYNQNLLNRVLELKDCYGNNYVVTIRELITKYKLGSCGINRLMNDKVHKGISPKNLDCKYLPTKNYTIKKYIALKGNKRFVGKTLEILGNKIGYSTGYTQQILAGKTSRSDIKFVGMETKKKSLFKL